MIGLDTNILARYYIQDEADGEAQKQHELAKKLIESELPLMVCKTALLELEWVMRGYQLREASDIAHALIYGHLMFDLRTTHQHGRHRGMGVHSAGVQVVLSWTDISR
ncbi:MAG: hypothetical protein WCP33_07970 [Deltaproteobacteria bacterium]